MHALWITYQKIGRHLVWVQYHEQNKNCPRKTTMLSKRNLTINSSAVLAIDGVRRAHVTCDKKSQGIAMNWPAPCMNSLHTSIHMNGIRDRWQGIQLSYTSTSHILAKWAGRNSPWRGGRERIPGSHRPQCPPCSPGTRSSWRRIATATATRKVGSKVQSRRHPFCLSPATKLPLDLKEDITDSINGRGDGEWRPNRTLARNSGSPKRSGRGNEMPG
jgi:hypothetical protein